MGRARGTVAGVVAMVSLVTGYIVADARDWVPGWITVSPERAAEPEPVEETPAPTGISALPTDVPRIPGDASPLAPAMAGQAVSAQGLARRIDPLMKNAALGSGAGKSSFVVADARSGQQLYAKNPRSARTPASIQKLVSAAALTSTLPLDTRLTTKVVQGRSDTEIALVAGGDSLLNPGYGDPSSAVGYAGLAELADQTAAKLRETGTTDVTLVLDDRYAKGPIDGPGWDPQFIGQGFTGPITMLALSSERAEPYQPAPKDPPMSAASAFRELLGKRGVSVSVDVTRAAAPEGGSTLASVESAPVRDILREALRSSDNAITESLARQAAARAGVKDLTTPSVGAWVVQQVGTLGIPTQGVVMKDASGLGAGSQMPMTTISQLLVLAADGKHPVLAQAYAELPVAGGTGTLSKDRFNLPGRNTDGRGFVRAKTGSLPAVSALAGYVSTQDGQLLVYVGVINNDTNVLEMRAALDDVGSALAGCGCS